MRARWVRVWSLGFKPCAILSSVRASVQKSKAHLTHLAYARGTREWELQLVHGQLFPEECAPQSTADGLKTYLAPVFPRPPSHLQVSTICPMWPFRFILTTPRLKPQDHVEASAVVSQRVFSLFLPLSCAQSIFQNTNVITEHACQGKSFASGREGKRQEEKGHHDLSIRGLPDAETQVILVMWPYKIFHTQMPEKQKQIHKPFQTYTRTYGNITFNGVQTHTWGLWLLVLNSPFLWKMFEPGCEGGLSVIEWVAWDNRGTH